MSGDIAESDDRQAVRAVVILLFAFAVIVLLRNAWVCDDAYITFRTSYNLVEGYGLTYNPGERVQAYTNPLWMFTMACAYLFTRNFFYTSIFLGIGISMVGMWLLCRRVAVSNLAALFVLAILLSSKAFVDYTTSGLENAPGHLLLIAFALTWFAPTERPERRAFLLGLFAAIGTINRLDGILLYLPALALEAWQQRRSRRVLYRMLLGLSPVVAWELFSLFYYGFPFPNTYYAKIQTDLPGTERLHQGFLYLLDSINRDPITMTAIAAGLAAAFASRERRAIAFAGGALLHILYVVWIGGDFMSGRFLTAPLVVAAVAIARWPGFGARPHAIVAAGVVFTIGLINPYSPIRASASYGDMKLPNVQGTAFDDERRVYYSHAGLLVGVVQRRLPSHRWRRQGREARAGEASVVLRRPIGFFGMFAGPDIHVIDRFGLADPLLARLRPIRKARWRPGHFERELPAGYMETLEQGRNVIEDPRLAEYYDKLSLVTRGPLWSWRRFKAIWGLNTGRWSHLTR